MPRKGRIETFKTNFTAGELDPLLRARVDIRAYANGAERIRNMLLLPQGGVIRRPGLEFRDQLPFEILRYAGTVVATAPNGGTAANANDDDEATILQTTVNMGTTSPYVVVQYDLQSPQFVRFVDYVDLRVFNGSAAVNDFRIQHSNDGSAWTNLATGRPITTAPETRRFLADVTARYWRIARLSSSDAGTTRVRVAEFSLWRDTGVTLFDRGVLLVPFEFSSDQRYLLAFTHLNARVYLDGVRQADIRTGIESSRLRQLNWVQSLDTLIAVHPLVIPRRLLRFSSDTEWEMRSMATLLANRPQFDFDDALSPTPVAEIQRLTFNGFATNDQFQLDLKGVPTELISWPGTSLEKRTRLQNALREHALVIGDGITVAHISGGNIFDVTFAGVDADDWGEMIGDTVFGSGTITVSRTQAGSPRRENVWSSTRGWPNSVVFHQQRMWFGGSLSRPQTLWGSQIGFFFDFNVGRNRDDEAIDVTLDSDALAEILQLQSGQHLQLFTTAGEYFVSSDIITPDAIRFRRSSRHGIEPGTQVFDDSGATLFIQTGGKAVREFLFNSIDERYAASNISLLASHLIRTPVASAFRRGTSTQDANYLIIVNAEGTAAILNTLRDQEVVGWSLIYARGLLEGVGIDGETIYVSIQRTIDGITRRYIERINNLHTLDSSVRLTDGLGTLTFGGLDHLEGETVKVIADGNILPDEVVENGEITIEREAEESLEIGIPFAPAGEPDFELVTLPVNVQSENGSSISGERKRIAEVILRLADSKGGIVARPTGTQGQRIAYQKFGAGLLDQTVEPFTGDKRIGGFLGWDQDGQVRVFEELPLPVTVLGIIHKVQI